MTAHLLDQLDVAARRRYATNLAALYASQSALAAAVDRVSFDDCPTLEPTRDGSVTARVVNDAQQPTYVHSRYQPLAEARELVAPALATEALVFVVHGLGLGHAVAELLAQRDQARVFVVEPDHRLIKLGLARHEWLDALRTRRLTFFTSADKHALHELAGRAGTEYALGAQFVQHPYTLRCHADVHRAVSTAFAEYLQYWRTQMVTIVKTARTTGRNVLQNLPHYLEEPGIEQFRMRGAGYPAVIVAAGPSLARHLPQLKQLRERAVVISVQTVYKLLGALGVAPHFVTSLDFHEVSADFFHDAPASDCQLVAEAKATGGVLNAFPGRKHVLHHRLYDLLLGDAAPRRTGLRAGSTVAHLALYLAQHLGCDPIVFIGQDLAYTEGMFYLAGSPIEQTWHPELHRYQTLEMKQWERIARRKKMMHTRRDIHGRPIYTDDLLRTYHEQFESEIAAAPQRIIQATEGGLPLAGADTLTLADVMQTYCRRPLPEDLFAPQARIAVDWAGYARELEARERDLVELHDIASEMSERLRDLEANLDSTTEFNRRMPAVDRLRNRIGAFEALYQFVVQISAEAELQKQTADRRLGTVKEETQAIAARRLKRDRAFVSAFARGCTDVREMLREAIALLEARAS